jgi:hypothetical protein
MHVILVWSLQEPSATFAGTTYYTEPWACLNGSRFVKAEDMHGTAAFTDDVLCNSTSEVASMAHANSTSITLCSTPIPAPTLSTDAVISHASA